MGTGMKFKNLLRGLHYISQFLGIEEEEEEEEEMQIGNPTDVKHVAHIGCDTQSINNSPSWMSEFRSHPPASDAENASAGAASDSHSGGGSTTRDAAAPPRSSRHMESPGCEGSVRGTRGHQSSGGANSPSREPSDGSKKGSRKHRGGAAAREEHLPAVPKKPHRRKPKGSSTSSAAAASSPRSKVADQSNGSGSPSRSEEQISDSSKPVAEGGEPK